MSEHTLRSKLRAIADKYNEQRALEESAMRQEQRKRKLQSQQRDEFFVYTRKKIVECANSGFYEYSVDVEDFYEKTFGVEIIPKDVDFICTKFANWADQNNIGLDINFCEQKNPDTNVVHWFLNVNWGSQ